MALCVPEDRGRYLDRSDRVFTRIESAGVPIPFFNAVSSRLPSAYWLFVVMVIAVTAIGNRGLSAEPSGKVSYSRDIRPILADKCLACHGADASHREGGLRLDEQAGAQSSADSGAIAVVPGHPAESELFKRMLSEDESVRMPPPESKKSLTTEEKSLLQQWIEEGAIYEKHWAFEAPVKPAVPETQQKNWVRNEIDSFVLNRLELEKLSPAAPADRAVLLRRITLDLTGLPPTVEELNAFQKNQQDDALEQVVDKLLDSPHYGERWGRFWLDGARYADSDGYEKDKPRFVWAYRDWVVQALNRDLPYNQFVIEQLAGDLLPNATQDQHVATGFLRNSMLNEEGGVDPEQFRMEAMFDRVDAIGKSMLGLTIQCCQCHDHKYDPISQKEYFQLFAFLNDTHESSVAAYTPDQQKMRADILQQISALEDRIKAAHSGWSEELKNWEQNLPVDAVEWKVVAPKQEVSGGQKHYVLQDGSILAQGYAPTKSTAEFEVTSPLESVQAIRLELLNHPDLPLNGPGRAVDGTCVLTEFIVEAAPADGTGKYQALEIAGATADIAPPEAPLAAMFNDKTDRERKTGPVALAIDQKRETGWSIDMGPGRSNVPRTAVFNLKSPVQFPGGVKLKFKLVQEHGGWNSDDNQTNNLGCFRLSVTDREQASVDPVPVPIRQIISIPEQQRSDSQGQALFSHWRTTVSDLAEINQQIEALYRQLPRPIAQPSLADREQHRPSFILAKGNFLQREEEVQKQVPAVLHPLQVANPTRLDFARWIVDEKSPTAARSIVNRIWQTYFGTGLVSTSDDFGLQGESPSHPELLDWLAVDFMEHGWSLKRLHRQVLNSATYRQSSVVTPKSFERDPENRLLARGARYRMEAEGVRDIAMAVSGLLNKEVGGPPVCPPCPEFLFQPPASYGPKSWPLAEGGEQYRRGLYTFRFRSIPYPALQVFDAPVGEVSCVRRVKSNTPLQALTTLNEPLYMECARHFARTLLEIPDQKDESKLNEAYLRCVARQPTELERTTLLNYLFRQRQRLEKGELNPLAINGEPDTNPSQEQVTAEAREQAAWTSLCRVLLNLDETITRE